MQYKIKDKTIQVSLYMGKLSHKRMLIGKLINHVRVNGEVDEYDVKNVSYEDDSVVGVYSFKARYDKSRKLYEHELLALELDDDEPNDLIIKTRVWDGDELIEEIDRRYATEFRGKELERICKEIGLE